MYKTTSGEALARRIYVFHFDLFYDEAGIASDVAPVRFTAAELEAIAAQYGRKNMQWPRSARQKVEEAIERQARVLTDDAFNDNDYFVRQEEMPWELGWACRRLLGLPEPEEDDIYSAAQEGDGGGWVLTVRVSADTLERVRAGRQRELRLDVTPYSRGYLVCPDEDGATLRDEEGHCVPASYEAVRLVGPDKASLLCRFTAQGHTPRRPLLRPDGTPRRYATDGEGRLARYRVDALTGEYVPDPSGDPLELPAGADAGQTLLVPETYECDGELCVREEVIYTLDEVINE